MMLTKGQQMLRFGIFLGIFFAGFVASAHAQSPFSGAIGITVTMTRDSEQPNSIHKPAESCTASQYGIGDGYHGRRTASGERFNTWALTAAHRTRRFGSSVQVTNRRNGRTVTVRITDRGPFVKGRCIDLSRAAANAIGMGGIAPVRLQ